MSCLFQDFGTLQSAHAMLESTIILIDNSEWTRSGDYAPSRFLAQADAVNLLAGAKTQSHPENTVGVLSMAGKTPRVLVTPTQDLGKVLNCMSDVEIESECNYAASIQIAQLALKHRQNKNQRQRIVIFVGSPLSEDKVRACVSVHTCMRAHVNLLPAWDSMGGYRTGFEEFLHANPQDALVKIAKKLKKNSVAVDIVSFGCEAENEEKLEAFHQTVNSNANSNFVTVPPGPMLSDVLISSAIFQGEDGGGGYGFGGGGGGGGGGGPAEGFEFGVDPNMDPDLALALRVSLEEERARQNAAAPAADGSTAAAAGTSGGAAPAAAPAATDMDLDEDALLQQALAMSMQVEQEEAVTPAPAGAAPPAPAADAAMFDVEDEELRQALAMSMQDSGPETKVCASAYGRGKAVLGWGVRCGLSLN